VPSVGFTPPAHRVCGCLVGPGWQPVTVSHPRRSAPSLVTPSTRLTADPGQPHNTTSSTETPRATAELRPPNTARQRPTRQRNPNHNIDSCHDRNATELAIPITRDRRTGSSKLGTLAPTQAPPARTHPIAEHQGRRGDRLKCDRYPHRGQRRSTAHRVTLPSPGDSSELVVAWMNERQSFFCASRRERASTTLATDSSMSSAPFLGGVVELNLNDVAHPAGLSISCPSTPGGSKHRSRRSYSIEPQWALAPTGLVHTHVCVSRAGLLSRRSNPR